MQFAINALIFILYATVSSIGLYKMKVAAAISSPSFIFGFVAYGAGMLIWLNILRRFPLSLAFPVAAGSLIVATQIVGMHFLGESLSTQNIIGIALVLIGIILIYVQF